MATILGLVTICGVLRPDDYLPQYQDTGKYHEFVAVCIVTSAQHE